MGGLAIRISEGGNAKSWSGGKTILQRIAVCPNLHITICRQPNPKYFNLIFKRKSNIIDNDCDTAGAEVREYKVEMRCVDKRAWVELGRTRETQYRAEK